MHGSVDHAIDLERAQGMAQLAQWYAQGLVKPAIDCKLPMADLAQAYARMDTRQVQGKVLLVNPA